MEEFVDTFDKKGRFLGIKPKRYCHEENPGCFHKPVLIWIMNSNNEILVQKRASVKKLFPNKWALSCAGHVKSGESADDACVRELKEELGLRVENGEAKFIKQKIFKNHHELAQIYILKKDFDNSVLKLKENEVSETKWVNYKTFKKLIFSDDFVECPKSINYWFCWIIKRNFKKK